MYQYIILDDTGSVVYADTDKHHTKQLADVLSMRTGKPHFVDCICGLYADHLVRPPAPTPPYQPTRPTHQPTGVPIMKLYKIEILLELSNETKYPDWVADAITDCLESGESIEQFTIEELKE